MICGSLQIFCIVESSLTQIIFSRLLLPSFGIATLNNIEKAITQKQRDGGREGIEKAIRKYCKTAKNKENTFVSINVLNC